MILLAGMLKKYRKAAGLNQEKVADSIGVSRSHYANAEMARKTLDPSCLTHLQDVLRLRKKDADLLAFAFMDAHLPDELKPGFSALLARLDELDARLKIIEAGR